MDYAVNIDKLTLGQSRGVGSNGRNPSDRTAPTNYRCWERVVAFAVVDFAVVGEDLGGFDADDGASWVGLGHWLLNDLEARVDTVDLQCAVGGR